LTGFLNLVRSKTYVLQKLGAKSADRYRPLSEPRVLRLARVEGMRDYLLLQGGTVKAVADAGVDAWRYLLAFLGDATKAHRS